jgi:hypothetical protein
VGADRPVGLPKGDPAAGHRGRWGSNGYRIRAWKAELARLAAEAGLAVTVCHFPPGTSKWNKIEHRLFSHISTNWRGRPLVCHEVIVELIAATTTHAGLRVRAQLDQGRYPLGVKVSDRELAAVPLRRHAWQRGSEQLTLADRRLCRCTGLQVGLVASGGPLWCRLGAGGGQRNRWVRQR